MAHPQAAFYCLLPAVYLAVSLRRGHLPWGTGGLLIALLVVLNVLEAYIFSVTLKVMTSKRKKARASRRRQSDLRSAATADPAVLEGTVVLTAPSAPQVGVATTINGSTINAPLLSSSR